MPRKKKNISDSYYDVFPSRLRSVIDEQNKTQQEVGEAIGKTRQAVSYYADGSSSPDWKTLRDLSKYFNVSADWLLGLTNEQSNDAEVKKVCAYTGLNENAVDFLHAVADIDENGVYLAGFTDDEYNPRKLLNDIFEEEFLWIFLVEFCDGINELSKTDEVLESKRGSSLPVVQLGELRSSYAEQYFSAILQKIRLDHKNSDLQNEE